MSKKVVLVVDENPGRAEKLVFILRLGGYATRVFSNETAALNWAIYGCAEGEALCLLMNSRIELPRAEQILSYWQATGINLPIVLVQRGKGSWNYELGNGVNDHFVVCEPESVMQGLEILTEIATRDGVREEKGTSRRMSEMGEQANASCKS